MFPDCFDNYRTIFDPVCHRFFDVDVLAGAEGIEHDALMPVIGCSHDNCVDIFPIQQFLVIGEIRRDRSVSSLLCAFKVPLVAIAYFNKVRLLSVFGSLDQDISANAETDEAEVYSIVRARWFRERRLRNCDQLPIHDERNACRLRRCADELPSG